MHLFVFLHFFILFEFLFLHFLKFKIQSNSERISETYSSSNNSYTNSSLSFSNVSSSNNSISIGFRNTSIADIEVEHQQAWQAWIFDWFYPLLAVILLNNTLRKIRVGFRNNNPQTKYTIWSSLSMISLILAFATSSSSWSTPPIEAVFLLIFCYMAYLWAQMRLHQAVTRLRKIPYAMKYLDGSAWVKEQLLWSWMGQLRKNTQERDKYFVIPNVRYDSDDDDDEYLGSDVHSE